MKVGDYVRTEDGQLFRWDKWFTTDKSKDSFDGAYIFVDTNSIIKSSPNIIDLIEVGDYVNGYLVKDIDYAFDDVVMNNKNARVVPYIDCNKNNYIDDIKSIVTKEQFESMEYKIGE